jgi:predicted ATPase
VQTLAYVNYHLCLFEALRGDRERAAPVAKAVLDLARERAMPIWESSGRLFHGWANWLVGDPQMELAEMRRGIQRLRELGQAWHRPYLGALLAEAEASVVNFDIAIGELDRNLAEASLTGQHWSDAELHRIRGEILLKHDPANTAAAEEAFLAAIAIAQQQKVRSFELRAALSLAKLYQSSSRAADAYAVLAPALEGFAPTPEFPEIAGAQALLDTLAQDDQVREAFAKQQARAKLHVEYARAVQWGMGFAADETKAAFARAGALAAAAPGDPEYWALMYGRFGNFLMRGEFITAHEAAATYLRQAQVAGRLDHVVNARRLLGTVKLELGAFRDSREEFEALLANWDEERDRALRAVTGADVLCVGCAYMAQALVCLGEVDAAMRMSEDAIRRAEALDDFGARAFALSHRLEINVIRGRPDIMREPAEALRKLASEKGTPLWELNARGYAVLAGGSLQRDPAAAANELREIIAAKLERKELMLLYHWQGMLAELQSAAGAFEDALVSVAKGLEIAAQTGGHRMDSYLYRVRGNILAKRDADAAEATYHEALRVAREQGTRTFELQAALSLAKLYQSTGRAADAQAVLAPALGGFSSTPEFPEIEEAQALLAELAEIDEVKTAAAARHRRLELQTSYANALIHARGHGARETSAAFAKIQALAAGAGDAAERFLAYYGLWVGSLNRGEPTTMRETAAAFLREAERHPGSPEAGVAQRISGLTRLYFGDYPQAKAHLKDALDILKSERDRDLAFRFGQDQVAAAKIYLALVLWPLGDVEQARELANQAATQAENSGNVPTLIYVKYHLCFFEAVRRDRRRALPIAESVVAVANERAMPIWESAGRFLHGWASWPVGDRQIALAEMRRGIERWRELGQAFHRPYASALLAEAEADAGNPDAALAALDDVIAEVASTDQHWSDAELHRIRAEILLKRGPANTAPAEEAFLAAIAIAQQQKARSFELRAALSLAKLYQSAGRAADAHAVLAPALEGFAPTPEFPEIAEAQALLAVLAQSDATKAEIARRQRRFRLQSAYGNALLHGRGMSPPETTAAFAKARQLADSIEDPSERFSTYYGLWVGPFIRGNLSEMREVAEAFMRDAERRPGSPEAGIAHRLLGTTCWYAGDYTGAQLQLDRALALYDHERDLSLASSFAYDQGVLAKFYLGMTHYALGKVDRGVGLIEESLRLALQGGHVPTVALARHYMVVFAAVRRNLDSAAPHAQALLDLGVTHGLPSWHGFAKFTLAWAERRGNPQALEEMRAALATQRDMDFRVEQPLFGTLLAEAEAAAGELDAALASVNAQLAAMEQTGERWFEAEVHRARGEILLKHDAANTAPAEEAFLNAVAIAQRQKARSFELRAALSLAKLYQSAGRAADAHAVLAPALEGFSPTPEFPEVEEARTLLSALAA